jgi:hypothetical protein
VDKEQEKAKARGKKAKKAKNEGAVHHTPAGSCLLVDL